MSTPVIFSTDPTTVEYLVLRRYTTPEGVVVHNLWSQLPMRREVAIGLVGELNDIVSQPSSRSQSGEVQYIALRLGADDEER
jgi:hypothetical protein